MNVLVGTKRAKLDDRDLLGVGGEARVYRFQDLAVKVYHGPGTVPAGSAPSYVGLDPALRAAKLAKLAVFPRGLPGEVVGPVDMVLDAATRDPVGFAMKAIDGAEELRRLSNRSWREGVVSNEAVTTLFLRMHAVLEALHARGIVVGDLNDGNVLFTGDAPWFIDADSMQFGSHPCQVGHERFLDPRLYGVDLSARPMFTTDTDWYAFGVLLFSSLLYVHPYGGTHPKYPTLLRRAEARQSVMRSDVKYPRAATPFSVLPDDLLDWFEAVFDQDRRGRLPERLLTLRWSRCACGVVHARSACPECASMSPRSVRQIAQIHGRCQAARVFSTTGRILCATVEGGTLRYVYEEGGEVRREDGTVLLRNELAPGMRFSICGRSTWIGYGGRLLRFDRDQLADRQACATWANLPVFDAGANGCFRVDREWLVDCDSGMRLGQVLEGQSWFRVGASLGFGFYRAGRLTVGFIFRPGRPGLRTIPLPSIEGRLIEAAASFDDRHILLELSTEQQGRVTNRILVLKEDGQIVGRLEGAPDSARALATLDGKAIVGDRILCATDQGLLSLEVDAMTGRIREGASFADTEPFVSAGARLLAGPGGSVYVVTLREVLQLRLIPGGP